MDRSMLSLSEEEGAGSRLRLFSRMHSIWERCASGSELYYTSVLSCSYSF